MKKILYSLIVLTAFAVLWTGCTDLKVPSMPEEVHSEEWSQASSENFHGNKVALAGLVSCPTCHGQDYGGGTSEVSCNSCHNGPGGHPNGWLNKTSEKFHGTAIIAAEGYQECALCHGEEYKGKKNSGGSCYICHNGPSGHPAEVWLAKTSEEFHGLAASDRGLSACAACHGEDYEGGISGTSCKTCHTSQSGHPAQGWLVRGDMKFHGARWLETGTQYCAGCHGEDLRGGDANISCYTCHNGPSGHPAEVWLVKTSESFHGLAASDRGLSACAACHGEDYEGGISGTSCKTCHTSQSGHPAQGWLVKGDSKFHGIRLSQTGTQYCAGCHGSDFQGGDAGVNCFTCHNGPSGHPYGWFDKNSSNYHGARIASEGSISCTVCHGSDFSGGISGVACSDCH